MASFWDTTGGMMQVAAAFTFLAQAVGAYWEDAIEMKPDTELVTFWEKMDKH